MNDVKMDFESGRRLEMTRDEVLDIIVDHTKSVIPALKTHVFSESDQLKALGANSLDRSDIVEMSMTSLNVNIPRVEIFGTKNIGELADLLYNKINDA